MPFVHMHEDLVLWKCLGCGKVIPEHETARWSDVKAGQAVNPQCCGREMRAFSSKKGAAQLDIVERARGPQAGGVNVEFHPHRPWWSREWEVAFLATPERAGTSEVMGWIGLGLTGEYEFLTVRGQEGKGPSRNACAQAIVELCAGSLEAGMLERN